VAVQAGFPIRKINRRGRPLWPPIEAVRAPQQQWKWKQWKLGHPLEEQKQTRRWRPEWSPRRQLRRPHMEAGGPPEWKKMMKTMKRTMGRPKTCFELTCPGLRWKM
jgi:hypothetical protein